MLLCDGNRIDDRQLRGLRRFEVGAGGVLCFGLRRCFFWSGKYKTATVASMTPLSRNFFTRLITAVGDRLTSLPMASLVRLLSR